MKGPCRHLGDEVAAVKQVRSLHLSDSVTNNCVSAKQDEYMTFPTMEYKSTLGDLGKRKSRGYGTSA